MRGIPEVKALFVNGERIIDADQPNQLPLPALGCPICAFNGDATPNAVTFMIHGTSYCFMHAKARSNKDNI